MGRKLMYVELKSGYSDDGPAWIGYVKTSKSERTLYFNDHAFQRQAGSMGNYCDLETGEEYWISGVKKTGSNRHFAGRGKIMIDSRAVEEYLALTGKDSLEKSLFEVVELEDVYPVDRIEQFLNETSERD